MNNSVRESLSRLKEKMPKLINFDYITEDKTYVFSVGKKDISITAHLVDILSDKQIINIIKVFSLKNQVSRTNLLSGIDFSLRLRDDIVAMEKPYNITYHANASDASCKIITEEREAALEIVNEVKSLLSGSSPSSSLNYFPACSHRIKCLDEIMALCDLPSEADFSHSFVNKQGESVKVFPIDHDGKEVGQIEYLDDGYTVTILRSDVETDYQGNGIGTLAYKEFIEGKLVSGKNVQSDSILSAQAQKVYDKLSGLGIIVNKNENVRPLTRGKITSLSRDSIKKQTNEFPIVYIDAVNMVEPGYRLKGDSVFSVQPGPLLNAKMRIKKELGDTCYDKTPFIIKEIDKDLQISTTYDISASSVFFTEEKPHLLGSDKISEIEVLIEKAKDILQHSENAFINAALSEGAILFQRKVKLDKDLMLQSLNKEKDAGYTM